MTSKNPFHPFGTEAGRNAVLATLELWISSLVIQHKGAVLYLKGMMEKPSKDVFSLEDTQIKKYIVHLPTETEKLIAQYTGKNIPSLQDEQGMATFQLMVASTIQTKLAELGYQEAECGHLVHTDEDACQICGGAR